MFVLCRVGIQPECTGLALQELRPLIMHAVLPAATAIDFGGTGAPEVALRLCFSPQKWLALRAGSPFTEIGDRQIDQSGRVVFLAITTVHSPNSTAADIICRMTSRPSALSRSASLALAIDIRDAR